MRDSTPILVATVLAGLLGAVLVVGGGTRGSDVLALVGWVLVAAAGVAAQWLLIRGAVLSALRAAREEDR